MEYAEDDDGVFAPHEEDAVGESRRQDSANLGFAAETRVAEGVLGGTGDGGFHFGEELVTQAGLLAVVPDRRVGDIHLGLDADDDAVRPSASWA